MTRLQTLTQRWADQLYDRTVRWLQYADHGRAYRPYEEGLRYFEQGRYDTARVFFTKALEVDPRYLSARLLRGICFRHLQEWTLARGDLSTCIEQDSREPLAFFQRGLTLMGQELPELALADFNEALHLAPDHFRARANRGLAYLALAQPQAAQRDFEWLIEAQPEEAGYHWGLGEALAAQSFREAAFAAYQCSISLHPQAVRGYLSRGKLSLQMRRHAEAERDLRHAYALAEAPTQEAGWLALACLRNDKLSEAQQYLVQAMAEGWRPEEELRAEFRQRGLLP